MLSRNVCSKLSIVIVSEEEEDSGEEIRELEDEDEELDEIDQIDENADEESAGALEFLRKVDSAPGVRRT